MGALVMGGDLEGTARPRGGLLENQGDVLALEGGPFGPGRLGLLEVGGEIQQVADFPGREIQQFEETAVVEVDSHDADPFKSPQR